MLASSQACGAIGAELVDDDQAIARILAILLERTGVDFSLYRRATVVRRIRNRMVAARVEGLGEYLRRLEGDADEPHWLAERIAIKVSRFYRNAAAFDFLLRDILPRLAGDRRRALRLWSAGCSHGEEAYTLAMLLEELRLPGTVDASDIDSAALTKAAAGVYPVEVLAELPAGWGERYLEPLAGASRPMYRVRDALRDRVRILRHDLTASAPPPGAAAYDLIACRNVLIYLQPKAQRDVLEGLVSVTADGGALCLGEAEWPPAAVASRLEPIHHRLRVFRAAPRVPGVDT